MATSSEIVQMAAQRAFGSRLVTNVYRGLVVEAIVAGALCPEWLWCSEDYYRYDFFHEGGTRLEVKQSAACQSWDTRAPSVPRWDIASRQGYWEGKKYTALSGRNADIYILAWHPIHDRERADHRDPRQWEFYVIPTRALPQAKTVGLTAAKKLASAVAIEDLRAKVEALRVGSEGVPLY